MNSMFSSCSRLKTLDIRSFDTSRVFTMGVMFLDCCDLQELDVSNFDLSSAFSIQGIF